MSHEEDPKVNPAEIVDAMLREDRFSQLLGIRVTSVRPGSCIITMEVRPEMMNGFGIAHGGVTFAFADSALAFASNSYGRLSVALETSISYPAPVKTGDTLTAVARELTRTRRIAIYEITVTNQDQTVVGLFKGTVYRTDRPAPGVPGS